MMNRSHQHSQILAALERGDYYPSAISFTSEFADDVQPLKLAKEHVKCLRDSGFSTIERYSVAGMGGEDVPGTQDDLEQRIAKLGPEEAHYFAMVTTDKTHLSFSRGVGGRPTWSIRGNYPSENLPKVRWMEAMAKLSIAAAHIRGFQYAVLTRSELSWAEFPPQPPLARYNHIVTVTESEVAEAYDDPDSFWRCWERVEQVGNLHICIRGLEDLDDEAWLARTFESTMHLARIAKPGKTRYLTPYRGAEPAAFAPWWEYGDIIADERAGYPALSFVGYDPSTRTVEYAGFCTNTDIAKGGPDPRHVLIREIHEVRSLVKAKKDREGRPVDTVRIVFAEEWMARRERRPLLDVGARVFFMDPKTGRDLEIKD
jgi:hypothetical protein